MIIDPDFLDHWRTGMVVDALGDPMAPIYIMRLWAHCQERKSDNFVMPVRGLKAQCKYSGDAHAFEAALLDAGFISRDGDVIHVTGWAEKNASLLAAWGNGSKGGRPKKEPKQNPTETQTKPSNNPAETQREPKDNPEETDKRREEKNTSPSLRSGEGRASRLPAAWQLPDEWRSWAVAERPDLDPNAVAAKFADYWRAKPGAAGRKLDWQATWRNWVREERSQAVKPGRDPPEPAWRREQRERTAQAVPGIAEKPFDPFQTLDLELSNVPSLTVDRQDF